MTQYRDTDSFSARRRDRARAKRFRQQATLWLNAGRVGPPPQPTTWFPELAAILKQMGVSCADPPKNFFVPLPQLSDEDNRYQARLARDRQRYAARGATDVSKFETPAAQTPCANTQEADDQWVERELLRVKTHARNIVRKRRGQPELPLPPPALRVGTPEWWESHGLAAPTIERIRNTALRLAAEGRIPESEWTPAFRQRLARYVSMLEATPSQEEE